MSLYIEKIHAKPVAYDSFIASHRSGEFTISATRPKPGSAHPASFAVFGQLSEPGGDVVEKVSEFLRAVERARNFIGRSGEFSDDPNKAERS